MKITTVFVLIALINSINSEENDDLVFDDGGEEASQSPEVINTKEYNTINDNNSNNINNKYESIEKFRVVPDVVTTVGHIFKLEIPEKTFSGSVDHYEIRRDDNEPLPSWLFFDEASSTLKGVPSKNNVGSYYINVIAHGTSGDIANDLFNITVVKFDRVKHKDGKSYYDDSEGKTLMTILLDAKFDDLKPNTKVKAIENLAGFLGLNHSAFSIHSGDNLAGNSKVINLIGQGNGKPRKEKNLTYIQWQVGRNGRLWQNQTHLLKQMEQQAHDRTLTEVIQLPVLRWEVQTDLLRNRRETGSGDYGPSGNNDDDYDRNYDYDDDSYYDSKNDGGPDNDDDDNEPQTELPPNSSATFPRGMSESEQEHPHRHHHGEETIDSKAEEHISEDDIVPVIDNKLERTPNTSATSIPLLTTIQQTSTTTTIITPTPSSSSSSTTTTTEKTLPTLTATNEIETSPIVGTVSSTTPSILLTTVTTTSTITPIINTIVSINVDTISTSLASGTLKFDNTTTTSETTNNNRMTTTAATNDANTDLLLPIIPTTDNEISTTTIVTTLPSTILSTINNKEVNVNFTTMSNETIDEPINGTDILTTTQVPTTPILSTITHHVPIVETSPTISSTRVYSTVPDVNTSSAPTTSSTTTISTTISTSTTTMSTPLITFSTTPRKIITDRVPYAVPNHPPTLDRQLQKIRITAGKPLSYIIPENTFSDPEDGNTRNLKLEIYFERNRLNNTHWLQFNSETQEVYGLPLEDDVSIWDYEVVVTDREGLYITDNLNIYVQQHKLSRTITHEFSIYLQIEKRTMFPTNVDWELKIIRNLAQLYGDDDASDITVRSIDVNGEQAIFTWTNDSVPRSSECPKDEINKLLHVLIANRDGDPSAMLQEILAPEIHVRRVVFQGLGQCEAMNKPESRKLPTQEPKTNFPPLPRNQVDHINATVGHLLVFRVPEDTFFDPEDGSARNLRMSLLTIDREPIPANDWLQFDVNNQEFYGIPMKDDTRRKEYQLVVTDKDGLSATDGLVVVVHPAYESSASAEFTIKLGTDYYTFSQSAMLKKNFIHRLRDLFGEKDTSSIQITSISPAGKNTVITWRNTTLPTVYCPNDEITRLSEVLFVKPDNKELTNRIERIMGSDYPVDQLTLTPMGICQGEFTRVHSNDNGISTSDESTTVGGASNDDYLITFVLPAIIIALMLMLAGVIACVLYRRKRSGKMSVSEHDDERQSFRSKGIPVIFQDELEEKPDPGNKSPVILKEEKPPLPPPEYQKGAEDGADQPMLPKENSEEPYQPPPPFARTSDNNRQNRPKPTPTYRKPPPYVPP